jgi:predicted PilT family ATPase
MKKSEFKEMIKESVKEVLVEEGVLKNVISEVVKAVGQTQITDQPVAAQQTFTEQVNLEAVEKQKQKLAETKRRMLDAIGQDSFGGIDIFEGTTPMKKGGTPSSTSAPSSALADVDPNDSGVDISGILGASGAWKQILK